MEGINVAFITRSGLFVCEFGQVDDIVQAKLFHDLLPVRVDGFVFEAENFGYLARGVAFSDIPKNLAFPFSQVGEIRFSGLRDSLRIIIHDCIDELRHPRQ